jgi:hypothetical protein
MRWLLPLLLAALLTFAVSLSSAGANRGAVPAGYGPPSGTAAPPSAPDRAVPRVNCERPRTLRLRRFEDRSARLECGGRVIVRVSVPG